MLSIFFIFYCLIFCVNLYKLFVKICKFLLFFLSIVLYSEKYHYQKNAVKISDAEWMNKKMKITPQILTAVQHAVEYYGNISQVAKVMGIAHSTVFFWLNGKTESMSGKLWKSRIRPVLAPFLSLEPGVGTSAVPLSLHEDAGFYQAKNGTGLSVANEFDAKEYGDLSVIKFTDLSKLDPSAESVRKFLKQHCNEKVTYPQVASSTHFVVRLENEFPGIFLPGTDLLINTEDFPENQSIVIARVRETGEVIMGKYTRSGSQITILSLRNDEENISWDCTESLGYTLWCFHVLEAKLDLREI